MDKCAFYNELNHIVFNKPSYEPETHVSRSIHVLCLVSGEVS